MGNFGVGPVLATGLGLPGRDNLLCKIQHGRKA